MVYFPFFLEGVVARFLPAFAILLAALALVAVRAGFFFGFRSTVSSRSSVIVPVSAACSMSTRSDHSRWYVDTSLYGSTCTFGRLRPLMYTFGLAPLVSTRTFF